VRHLQCFDAADLVTGYRNADFTSRTADSRKWRQLTAGFIINVNHSLTA